MIKVRGRILSFAITAGLIFSTMGYEPAQAGNLAYCVQDCSNWQRRCNRGEFAPRYNSIQACLDETNRCADRCMNKPFSLQQQPSDRRESAARG
ncbi:hypothetical protein [Bradyrhizobium sp.]